MHGTAITGLSAPPEHDVYPAQLIIDMLRAGLGHIDTNRDAAAKIITQACSVLESAGGAEPGRHAIRGGLLTWQIRRVKAHIESHLDRSISVIELAGAVRLGPSYFQRAFKRSFGVSPHAFILDRRIRRAQTLMLTTQDSLCAIALAAGFSDQSHLTTRFHRAIGITPSTWRRERRGGESLALPAASPLGCEA